jgi:hypothetical protein
MTAIATAAAQSPRIPLPQTSAPTVWVSFPDGSVSPVDVIAVERAARGRRSGWTLTATEIQYAAPFMFGALPYSVVCSRLGISAKRLKALFPEVGPTSARAARPGPRRKARRTRAKRATCNTYAGAPGVAA